MTAPERALRTEQADELCRSAFATALGGRPERGLALVAVGGYGRGELAPSSDLDVVLVHEDGVPDPDVVEVATRLWYPLWDSGRDVDHSVRALPEVRDAAVGDLRVALGLLDTRHLAGDTAVSLQLRADVLAAWRRGARVTLPHLRAWARHRDQERGELAHAAVPDLKDSAGGIRDTVLMKALVATWLVDVPHQELERSRRQLLDVRDLVHDLEGRGVDRIRPELWGPLAGRLGLPDAESAQRHVRGLGRRTTHLSRLAWRRADAVVAVPSSRRAVRDGRPGPVLEAVEAGVAVSSGEVVLDREARPAADPLLLLRAAAVAAERDLPLGPASVVRLLRESPELPVPWPSEARELLVRLLAGPGLVQVWESLEELRGVDRLLPEWERLRLLPHASVIHRFTVDRHVLETVAEAGRMIRRVARPDLLLVASLLHDIGKGGDGDHSTMGEPIAREVCTRWGFTDDDVDVVGRLVRHHLLLPQVATTRDLDDTSTVASVVARLADRTTLDLLEVLTEADARATSSQAWTSWRAQLVGELVRRARRAMVGVPETSPNVVDGARQRVEIRPHVEGLVVHVRERDRVGLLADLATTFLDSRLPVVSAKADTRYGVAWSTWVLGRHVDPAHLVRRLLATLDGDPPPGRARLSPALDDLPPEVVVADVDTDATVLEVRAQDRPGTLYAVLRALAGLGLSARSAHLGSIGPQVVDVFYLLQPDGTPLPPALQDETVAAVRRALSPAVTLDA
jgi:[protein-PII] uridylyltransferase